MSEMIKERPKSLGASLYSKERRHAEAKAMWRIYKAYKLRDAADRELSDASDELDRARKVP